MEMDIIEIDQTIIYKSPKGYMIYEFFRLGKEEDFMSDNVLIYRYDSRKKSKPRPSMILVKDLPTWINDLVKDGFERIS